MWLIDATAYRKQLMAKAGSFPYMPPKVVEGIEMAIADLRYAPTIDAVPVVRCKDCKHYKEINGKSARMACFVHLLTPHPMLPDDFCSRGERKDGAEDG